MLVVSRLARPNAWRTTSSVVPRHTCWVAKVRRNACAEAAGVPASFRRIDLLGGARGGCLHTVFAGAARLGEEDALPLPHWAIDRRPVRPPAPDRCRPRYLLVTLLP